MHSHLGRFLACRMNRILVLAESLKEPIGHKLAKPGIPPFRSRSKGIRVTLWDMTWDLSGMMSMA
jgi:hypothetical protein